MDQKFAYSQSSYVETLIPNVMVVGEAFEMWFDYEGGAL